VDTVLSLTRRPNNCPQSKQLNTRRKVCIKRTNRISAVQLYRQTVPEKKGKNDSFISYQQRFLQKNFLEILVWQTWTLNHKSKIMCFRFCPTWFIPLFEGSNQFYVYLIFPDRGTDFYLRHRIQLTYGAHRVSYPMGTGAISTGVKRLEHEAVHSPPSSAEVKKYVDLYLHSTICLHGVVLSLSTGTPLPSYLLPETLTSKQ